MAFPRFDDPDIMDSFKVVYKIAQRLEGTLQ